MPEQERIDALETKVAFQDEAIEELNKEVFKLQKMFLLVKEQVEILAVKLKETEPGYEAVEQDDLPPHY